MQVRDHAALREASSDLFHVELRRVTAEDERVVIGDAECSRLPFVQRNAESCKFIRDEASIPGALLDLRVEPIELWDSKRRAQRRYTKVQPEIVPV